LRITRFADQLLEERDVGRTRLTGLQVLAFLVDERFESTLEGGPLELLLPRFAAHPDTP
jgi:hypothetical protein